MLTFQVGCWFTTGAPPSASCTTNFDKTLSLMFFAQIADVTAGAFQFLCNTATNLHKSPCCLAGITGKFFGHLSSIVQTVVVSCHPRFICRSSTNVNFPWTRQKFFQTCRPIDVPCVSTVTSLQEHSKQSVRQFKVGQMQSYQQKKMDLYFCMVPSHHQT